MIEYQNVRKVYGDGETAVTAVNDVSFKIAEGEVVVFLGPSGCGKTTLLRMTNKLESVTGGAISVGGRNIREIDPVRLRRSMGYVIQQIGLFPNKTIFDNIAMVPRVLKWDRTRIKERVDKLMELVKLDPDTYSRRYPVELSGGQQQRTAIARALVKDARLLLLDEPLVNLDYKLREELQTELQEIFRQRDAMVVYTTTEPGEALKFGGNIVVLDEGRVLQTGPTTQVYRNPANLKVAEVFSDPPINYLDCRVEARTLTLASGLGIPMTGHLKGLNPGSYTLGVRSNNLSLGRGLVRRLP